MDALLVCGIIPQVLLSMIKRFADAVGEEVDLGVVGHRGGDAMWEQQSWGLLTTPL